jgi:stringent starvation protein B
MTTNLPWYNYDDRNPMDKYKILAYMIEWLIDWCLTPTLAVFLLYRGVINL